MQIERTVTLKTVEDGEITLELRNTMRHDVRYEAMAALFAAGKPDEGRRDDFCWLFARVVKGDGLPKKVPTEASTPEQFDTFYYALTDLVSLSAFLETAQQVSEMKRNGNLVEKPDNQLTEEEQADPNS